jgi:hypothetical protein
VFQLHGKFIESGLEPAPNGNEGIDRAEDYGGRLAQTDLRAADEAEIILAVVGDR